ncbi:EAL domain-containing protein [Kangiella sp. HZ709]|uniref:EAL domain-containing protein n=1 Tax=Kangiella sp. HZ709 TaxID=2666328 RepID=UPI0012B0FED8|nr:EAL domain-containing protein [Kangiella sp. HZ709]MRX28057.1 EAL domain-containing protein [Kangiella sp. HZ709]
MKALLFSPIVRAALMFLLLVGMGWQSTYSVYAQSGSLKVFEIESELSHSIITDIIQDNKGYIWAGTAAGLNRYDGHSSQQFFKRTDNLSSDDIRILETDSYGNVWIGTDNGLNVYWQEQGVFESFFHNPANQQSIKGNQILSIAKAYTGDMWIGTENGVSYFQADTKNFLPIELTNAIDIPLANKEVSALINTKSHTLLGTSGGKIAILNDKGYFQQIDNKNVIGNIKQFAQKSETEVYVLSNSGLYVWNISEQELSLVDVASYGIDEPFLEISSIIEGNDKTLWLGTERKGLFHIELDTVNSHSYFSRRGKDGLEGVERINTLLKDRTGIVWIATDANLHHLNPNLIEFDFFSHHGDSDYRLTGDSVFSVMQDADGWYWFGTEFDGLNVFKPGVDGLVYAEEIQLPDVSGNAINEIIEGANGQIWIFAADSVWTYDKNTEEFNKLNAQQLEPATLYAAEYYRGEIWIGTDFGLWRLDQQGKLKQYLLDRQQYSLINKVVALDIDEKNKKIWLGTEQGIVQFDIATESLKNLNELISPLPTGITGSIYDVYQDIHQRLWVGTYQNGLYKVDFATQKISVLNNATSMLNNTVYSIMADKNNFLWVATARGLFRLDANENSLTHFSLAQGQPIRDFNLGAKALDNKGKVLLAGINGVIHFDSNSFQKDPYLAIPIITNILINGEVAKVGLEDAHINKAISSTEELTLYHDETSLSIAFSAMHYASPKNNRFRYQLEGFDKDWIEVDANDRRAVYGKLEPSDYQFKLLASNKDGVWNKEPRLLNIKVLPSPYFSNFALLFYTILSLLAMLTIFALYQTRAKEKKAASQKLAESEERLKLSLWGSGDELWDWNIQSGELFLSNEWNMDFPRDGMRSGYTESNSNIHPNDLPFVKRALQAHINGKSGHFESTYRISDEKGKWLWVLDQGKIVESDGNRAVRMAGTLKNVSDLKEAEQKLSIIVKSFENISDAVWILDAELKYVAINQAFETITHYSAEEVVGAPMQESAIKDMNDGFYARLMKLLDEKGSWQGELEAIRKDGSVYPIDINIDVVRDNDGNITNYVGVFSDITYRKIAEKELRRLATTDQLTGLPNRNTFRAEVETILSHSSEGKQHALLFVDLDNFKQVNDSLGHSVGDELLIKVAENLIEVLGNSKGTIARLGGDEFIMFLEDVEVWNQPAEIAQAVLDKFTHKLELSESRILVSPSIGIVMYPENGASADKLLRNADTAMYYAKKKGKNTFQFYTRQMNEQAKLRLNLETELRAAIEKDEFVVFYQPKVSLASGKITGFEALIRWRSEKRGLVMPNEFIPLAEETGLIIPISQQVIEKSCIQVRDWQKRGIFDGKMAINLSAIQFYHENLWETVKNALHLANVDASSIEFEITEGMVMQDLAHSIQQMHTLKDMGVSLALDDFGVGYSSLGNLKDFPIDTLKVDRSFVWDLDDSERDKKLVASIITLAHNLDIKVVAEGVETIKQVQALEEMKCEEIQGFIYSRPLPAFEVEKLLIDKGATLSRALKEAHEDEMSD